jgi:hypothetical protein
MFARSLAVLLILYSGGVAVAQEEAKFRTVKKDGPFEVRVYEPRVVAETFVDSSFADAGNLAFKRLFAYISGENKSRQKVAMTAPVTHETSAPSGGQPGQKIAMTAPVTQENSEGKFRVTFVLPASFTIENAPVPTDPLVTLKSEPEQETAVIRYSGSWNQKLYSSRLKELSEWMTSSSLVAVGEPVWARYNPPFSLPILRRNEILVPIRSSASQAAAPRS